MKNRKTWEATKNTEGTWDVVEESKGEGNGWYEVAIDLTEAEARLMAETGPVA